MVTLTETITFLIAFITLLLAWIVVDTRRPFVRLCAIIALSWATIAGAIYIMELARGI